MSGGSHALHNYVIAWLDAFLFLFTQSVGPMTSWYYVICMVFQVSLAFETLMAERGNLGSSILVRPDSMM